VSDQLTGEHRPVSDVIEHEYARALQLRLAVKDKQMDDSLYARAVCVVPVSFLMHRVVDFLF